MAKPKKSEPADLPTILELKMALEDWEPPSAGAAERLQALVAQLEQVPLDLSSIPDEKLMATDTLAQNRRLYIGSLLRLWHYLAQPPESQVAEEQQARLALGYIRHIEGSKKLSVDLSLGRTQGDAKLASDVAELRSEMVKLVDKKRKLASKVIDVKHKI